VTTSVPDPSRRLGYADNVLLGLAMFGGQPVDATSLLIKYTYAGDADFDGDVDVADLGLLASGWQQEGVWTGGDFDYSGLVDVADLGLLASNWQAGVGSPLGPGSWEQALQTVGLGSVPEPGTVGWVIALVALMRRRPHP
jgi:hypothetical protein